MKKYIHVFYLTFTNHKVFQFDFIMSFLAVPLQLVITFFFWNKILPGSNIEATSSEIVLYFLLLEILQISFSPAMFITYELWKEINKGTIIIWLTRPISYPLYILFQKIALFFLQAFLPLSVVVIVSVTMHFISIPTVLIGCLSSLLGFFLLFIIQFIIGCFSFWLQNVIVLRDVIMSMLFMLGGLILPIELTPTLIQKTAFYSPIAYIYYFPAKILSGQLVSNELLIILLIQIFWCFLLALSALLLWRKGSHNRITQGA